MAEQVGSFAAIDDDVHLAPIPVRSAGVLFPEVVQVNLTNPFSTELPSGQ
jgi:hypothetical protein